MVGVFDIEWYKFQHSSSLNTTSQLIIIHIAIGFTNLYASKPDS